MKLDPSIIVCECNDISAETVLAAIRSGCKNVDEIEAKTTLGDACGQCKSLEDDPFERREYHITEDFFTDPKF